MFTLGPYTVSGSPITLNAQQANTQSSQPIVGALVYNNSNETFKIEWAGISDWLHPYSIYTVNATGNNFPNISLTPQDDSGSGSVYSTVYQQGDAMPANVPTTINATNVNLAPGSTVELAPGATVALASGSEVTLASGTTVTADLASGATVALASGSEVALASGSTVTANLASGSSVNLSSGAAVDVNGNVSIVNAATGDTTKIATALAKSTQSYTLSTQENFTAATTQYLYIPLYTTSDIEEILYYNLEISGYANGVTFSWWLSTVATGYTTPTISGTAPSSSIASGSFAANNGWSESLTGNPNATVPLNTQIAFVYGGSVAANDYIASGSSFAVIQSP